MRSFLLGAPVEGAFNIPFKVEKSSLPYDYAVEYVQSNGTQYVATGVSISSSTAGYEAKVAFARHPDWASAFGSRGTTNSMVRISGALQLQSWLYNRSFAQIVNEWSVHDVVMQSISGAQSAYLDGVQKTLSGTYAANTNGQTFSIFANHRDSNNKETPSTSRLYSLRIWEDGNDLLRAVPCVKDGVPCIYDEVGKRFLYPAVGDQLIAGTRI